ncbi:ASCH domain-containing protein [Maricaulis sp.]|uniref:ASCH domain-containing protein n=1 Tax=Maricaulis sp. TaxID=1486257 RepID=UPI0026117B84|nr:ASCH domain-containing protein [Maricaulis sp.]
MTPQQADFWRRFQDATGDTSDKPFDIDQFGDSEAMGDELLELVLAGTKQATCALARWYEGREHRPPKVGDLSIITDGRGKPRCVIRTTSVEIKPITQADAQFAWDEGEGDRSFEWWLREHIKFWQREAEREGFVFSTDMDAVFERFELVWAP